MPLPIPESIRKFPINTQTILYEWDDWAVDEIEEPIDEELYTDLEKISCRANVVFSIGMALWILHRLGILIEEQEPPQYLESAWSTLVDVRYCGVVWEDHIEDDDWRGPLKGPVNYAMNHVMEAVAETFDMEQPEIPAALSYNLAKYLMEDPTDFKEWSTKLLELLTKLYPRTNEDPLGPPIPFELFDLEELDPSLLKNQLNSFLSRLDYRSNPFLNSPDGMREEGFEDTPYQY